MLDLLQPAKSDPGALRMTSGPVTRTIPLGQAAASASREDRALMTQVNAIASDLAPALNAMKPWRSLSLKKRPISYSSDDGALEMWWVSECGCHDPDLGCLSCRMRARTNPNDLVGFIIRHKRFFVPEEARLPRFALRIDDTILIRYEDHAVLMSGSAETECAPVKALAALRKTFARIDGQIALDHIQAEADLLRAHIGDKTAEGVLRIMSRHAEEFLAEGFNRALDSDVLKLLWVAIDDGRADLIKRMRRELIRYEDDAPARCLPAILRSLRAADPNFLSCIAPRNHL